jgi:hypothetical protein
MMDARKLLINLLYLATAQSSELPGWSHRETKKPHFNRLGVIGKAGVIQEGIVCDKEKIAPTALVRETGTSRTS